MSAREIMTMIRYSRWLYVVIFVLGGAAGALLRPYGAPVLYERLSVYPMQDGCDFHFEYHKFLFGSLAEMGHGGGKLACDEWTDRSPTLWLQCKCRK
jgi:hypothetical protein